MFARVLSLVVLALGLCLTGPAAAQKSDIPPVGAPLVQSPGYGPFKDWAALVVAADFHAHSGEPAENFDNARRDLSNAFIKAGFATAHVSQFSVRPNRYPDHKPLNVAPVSNLFSELSRQSDAARAGCLVYFTSHGNTDGIVLGEFVFSPGRMKQLLDQSCGRKPTIAIVSACYSGVFVPALAGPMRVVMTAARPDRSSFGCREEDVYTFFDECVLQALPSAQTFPLLYKAVQACVEKKEIQMRADYAAEVTNACTRLATMPMADRDKAIKSCVTDSAGDLPPSEPQLSIGKDIEPLLATLRLDGKAPG